MTGLVVGLVVIAIIIIVLAVKNHKDKQFAEELPNNGNDLAEIVPPQELNGCYGFKNEDSFLKFGTEILGKMVKDEEVDSITEISDGALNAILGSIPSWEKLPKEEYNQDISLLLSTNRFVAFKGTVKHPEAGNKVYVYIIEYYGTNSIICTML